MMHKMRFVQSLLVRNPLPLLPDLGRCIVLVLELVLFMMGANPRHVILACQALGLGYTRSEVSRA